MKKPRAARKPVQPMGGLAPWVGGKSGLAKHILSSVDGRPHRVYVEPFVGMGGLFFRRRLRPKLEVVNDLNGEVINLFRIVKNHPEALLAELSLALYSREAFNLHARTAPEALTDLQRAARFYYLQRYGYGGRPAIPKVAPATKRHNKSVSLWKLRAQFAAAQRRLASVTIEQLPYGACMQRYDGPETLFYLDPPYWGCEDYYGKGLWQRESFEELAEHLATIQGRFVLSLNDLPEVRRTFRRFHQRSFQTHYTVHATGTLGNELVITGGGRR